MLLEESLWYKSIISRYVNKDSLVVNIGSSTKQFTEFEQPYIKLNLIDELLKKHCTIINVDLKSADGVDLVGDITDADFKDKIRALKPKVIICSNVLEHLNHRKNFCDALVEITSEEAILIISVPHSFPYHEDPIDTMFRPDIAALSKEFPKLKLVEGDIIDCGSYFTYSTYHMTAFSKFRYYIRILRATGRAYIVDWKRLKNLLWFFRKISVSCVVFKRTI